MLGRSAQTAAGLVMAAEFAPLSPHPKSAGSGLAACDWSIGKMGDPAAFEVAKQIGLDGCK